MKSQSTWGSVGRWLALFGLRGSSKHERRKRGTRPSPRFESLEDRQLMSVSPASMLPDATFLSDGSVRFLKDSISQAYYAPSVNHQDFNFVHDLGTPNPSRAPSLFCSQGEHIGEVTVELCGSPNRGPVAVIDPRAVDRINLSSMALQSSGGAIGAQRAQIAVIDPRAVDRINLAAIDPRAVDRIN